MYTNEIRGGYYLADSLAVGRVELCHQRTWRTVCKGSWTREDVAVACSQLGFSRAGTHKTWSIDKWYYSSTLGAVNGSGSFRSVEGLPPIRDTKNCSGTEAHVNDCPTALQNEDRTCGHSDNSYIVCQGNNYDLLV